MDSTGHPGRKRAPGPAAHPIAGNLKEFRQDPLGFLLEARRAYGDVVRFYLGPYLVHLVSHPDGVRHVLSTHQENYHKDLGGPVAMALRHAAPSPSRCPAHAPDHSPAGGHPWFGGAIGTLDEAVRPLATAMLREEQPPRAEPWLLTSEDDAWRRQRRLAQPVFHPERIGAFAAAMTDSVAAMLDRWQGYAERGQPFDVAPEMARLTLGILARTLYGTSVSSDTSIFIAGQETTPNVLVWTWYLLARNPLVDHRLHAELAQVLGGRNPEADDLPRLRYTLMVLQESMRLYPPTWMVTPRVPLADDEICGYEIPADSVVLLSPYVTHRHPDFWTRPESFDPERFAGQLPAPYFPFGGGPRTCIGNNFALVEARLVVAMVAQRYRLDLVPNHPVEPTPIGMLRPRHGLLVTLHPRERGA